ncbi:RNA-binding domain-containing protein [Thermogladius sp. 4427co]|uniref:RNA-binding domain-containing protein n=1 Tax=Thermogladius sp. 4427co TaxID=3450718 RepID=UPI003F79D5B4
MAKIIIEAEVRPTEELEKVKNAIENLYEGELQVEQAPNGWLVIRGVSSDMKSLRRFRDKVKINGIEPAVRNYLLKNKRNNETSLMLHKQAAYVGKISLIDSPKESPLGPIVIVIEGEDVDRVIDYLTG